MWGARIRITRLDPWADSKRIPRLGLHQERHIEKSAKPVLYGDTAKERESK